MLSELNLGNFPAFAPGSFRLGHLGKGQLSVGLSEMCIDFSDSSVNTECFCLVVIVNDSNAVIMLI